MTGYGPLWPMTPGALVGVAGRVVQNEPERQRRGGRHDGKQQKRGLDAAPPEVTHGEAAHEQDAAHRPQSSSPTRAPSCPVVPPVNLVSSTNAPSRIEIIRSAVAAIRASCVTTTSVCPDSCRLSKSRRTSRV